MAPVARVPLITVKGTLPAPSGDILFWAKLVTGANAVAAEEVASGHGAPAGGWEW